MASATGLEYIMTCRYEKEGKVTAYGLKERSGAIVKASKELVAYYIGRNMLTNVRCERGNDGKIHLFGIGFNIEELPVKQENVRINNVESKDEDGVDVPKHKITFDGTNREKARSKYKITGIIVNDGVTYGYVLEDGNGNEKRLVNSIVLRLAKENKIDNAYIVDGGNSEAVLVGKGCKLEELPKVSNKSDIEGYAKVEDTGKFERVINVRWEQVKELMTELEPFATMDRKNNAAIGYKYPTIAMLEEEEARLIVKFSNKTFTINSVDCGDGTNSSIGIRFICYDDKGVGSMIKCIDMGYLSFHLHSVSIALYSALRKVGYTGVLEEIYFEDKEIGLSWREYFNKKGEVAIVENKSSNKNVVKVSGSDIATLANLYEISLNLVSRTGRNKRYPNIGMLCTKEAKMSINTSSGYFEVQKAELDIEGNNNITLHVTDKFGRSKMEIQYDGLEINDESMKNLIIICAAAFKGGEQIQDIIVENSSEGSVLAYEFKCRIH